ncbi:MAG: hypothetical protein COX79_05030 [Candidatus Levybacteria bacterium CG_4_10_14_0_2_um_filter_36_16]|nr:MAG: hypothetical protein AUK12_04150 [Candidatus Levybacteria bacterium CG2_30_37_29]PIR78777.1 MAG: hypothetical protein COU26_04730 [Candidatus Levybacteria bacterium CG10_big_fil_rev_8_21_14_0_10_36_30]PIZ96493.1 MAG: hypothetical protein COX79_05030 [Candidatus Levybacteria bacterium CG_4_10_14_0_2_um_filter_36_16]PJA90785.1 MAG: hypothetical protein CO136_00640 [Candidatus Levybacteria bacterium CG_4_9_14_3_um_filter_36_7]
MALNKIFTFLLLNKRQKLVTTVIFLSLFLFLSEFFTGSQFIFFAIALSILTNIFLYLILREDIKNTFYYPIFILPFLYTLAFSLFYSLIPARILTRLILTGVYGFGLYSLFLTQNIFAVSGIRTINLQRSARIVSFVVTIVALFFLINISFSLRLPIYILPLLIFTVSFFLNFQSLWAYTLDTQLLGEITISSILISFCVAELSLILIVWPVNAAIYSIFLTGICYTYIGLSHAWIEKRLFKGILWEYVWVGFLSVLILLIFSKWGI